jgi:hypothetical protein
VDADADAVYIPRWWAYLAGGGRSGALTVRSDHLSRPRVAGPFGETSAGEAGPPKGLSDSVRLRGPERLEYPSERPFAQAGLRLSARDRGELGEPGDDLAF